MLLGLRTQLKEDLQCSTTELVYGTTLRLRIPGEFFSDCKADTTNPASYVTRLKSMMQQLQAKPVHKQNCTNVYVSPTLKSCTHVFIHHDAVKKPLQKPYDGPYKVQKRSDKHYTVNINGRDEVISIDRLKPAFHDIPPSDESILPLPEATTQQDSTFTKPARVTRSGRQVHWPKCFSSTSSY